MRRVLRFCSIIAGAIILALPQAIAQSGVMSGPPQITKDTPSPADPPGRRPPPDSPGPRSQDERPGMRSQNEPPGRRDPDDRGGTWIAVAGGFDGKGQNVGVGYSGHHTSRIDAENAALRACDRYGRGVRCREPYAVPTGCLYIVPGNRRGGVTWGRGSTRQLALDQCRRGGYRCDTGRVVGGCVP